MFTGDKFSHSCNSHVVEEVLGKPVCEESTIEKEIPSTVQRFGYGFLAVFIISIMSLGGLLVFPIIYRVAFQYILATFTALAVGTLFGDTMFHLIPFTMGLHSHASDGHGHVHEAENNSLVSIPVYQWRMFITVIVLYGFYLLEVILHWISHFRQNENSAHSHAHGHSHTMQLQEKTKTDQINIHATVNIDENLAHDHHSHNHIHHHNYNERDPTLACVTRNCSHHDDMQQVSASQEKVNTNENKSDSQNSCKITRVTGWMIILGDGIHNFADGLAIGAAFSERLMLGLTTTIAIGCHELPHEFGDYAVLIQSGFSHNRAIFWNFISATTALIGFLVGAAVSTNESVRQWIFAVTIGMFLYIALVDLLPTLISDRNIEFKRFICVNIGFLFGVTIMFLLACFLSNTTYTLCSLNHTNISNYSKLFHEVELAKHCHEHFVKKLLGKSCGYQTTNSPMKHKIPTIVERYVYGFIAIFIVSALSLVGILTLPILYKVSFKYVLNLFTAVAIGTLLGDAMFHLIPFIFDCHNHNMNDYNHDHSSFLIPSHQWKILLAVLILYIFYLLEIFLHWFVHYKHDHISIHSHIHNHSNKTNELIHYTQVDIDADIEHSHLHHNPTHHNLHQHLNSPSIYSNARSFFNNTSSPCIPCSYSNEHHLTTNSYIECNVKEKSLNEQVSLSQKMYTSQISDEIDHIHPIIQQLKIIKSTGWMILFGDSIHNFADGLAIGAAFSEDLMLGITTTIAVACHELPHELGDYAVLLQSGFSHSRALLWNFLSATTAIIGFFIGSIMSNNENARQWIFAATIGMFLYIALADLLPTLLTDGELELKHFLVVNIGFLFGIAIMFLLALFEDKILRLSTR
ncbi:unnamed protein product [Rotaria sp. Silwood1]|nr:unnamed protein product [Rotaria sp. Silwood1]CAF3460743.1 unnamed protein product [Rotaria sp. Silwood1]CAF4622694.1 unnamed protein product [Rotaria sp. Silwood1]CAF4624606.1 unnamed protein product [Rotaria sp. Silwood1]